MCRLYIHLPGADLITWGQTPGSTVPQTGRKTWELGSPDPGTKNFSTYAALSLRTDSLEAGEATSGSEGIF